MSKFEKDLKDQIKRFAAIGWARKKEEVYEQIAKNGVMALELMQLTRKYLDQFYAEMEAQMKADNPSGKQQEPMSE